MLSASILAIGTELTTGQIVNNNASWISKKLKDFGFITKLHLVVPDQRELILEALNFCAQQSSLLIITGGLGPTSDDLTRALVSEWSGKPLRFDSESWVNLEQLMNRRGMKIRDLHRHQCYFPETSTLLTNTVGTAHGFKIETLFRDQRIHVIALPGPPLEIEAIWKDHLNPWFEKLSSGLDKIITESWDILGAAESEIATLVESIFINAPVDLGYRIHLPYVEFKVNFKSSDRDKIKPLLKQVDFILDQYIYFKNGVNPADKLIQLLEPFSEITIEDSVTNNKIYQRLQFYFRDHLTAQNWTFRNFHKTISEEIKKIKTPQPIMEKKVNSQSQNEEQRQIELQLQPQNQIVYQTEQSIERKNENQNQKEIQIQLKLKKLTSGVHGASLILPDQQFNTIIDMKNYERFSPDRYLKLLTEKTILYWYETLLQKETTEN